MLHPSLFLYPSVNSVMLVVDAVLSVNIKLVNGHKYIYMFV